MSIVGNGAVGTVLTVQPPSWNVAGTATTYQWLRGTNPIGGETGNLYTVTSQDVGQNVTVVATGNADGYRPGRRPATPLSAASDRRRPPSSVPRSLADTTWATH